MNNWFHQFLNPHCPECAEERMNLAESSKCQSCSVLQLENARLVRHNDELIRALLSKTNPEESVPLTTEFKPILPTNIPWSIRRQMIEKEARIANRIRKESPKPDSAINTNTDDDNDVERLEDLEKEILNAQTPISTKA